MLCAGGFGGAPCVEGKESWSCGSCRGSGLLHACGLSNSYLVCLVRFRVSLCRREFWRVGISFTGVYEHIYIWMDGFLEYV